MSENKTETAKTEAATPETVKTKAVKNIASALDIGMPGFSRFVDGNPADGLLHTAAALSAAVTFGPLGFFLVGANAISRTRSGRNLWEHDAVKNLVKKAQQQQDG